MRHDMVPESSEILSPDSHHYSLSPDPIKALTNGRVLMLILCWGEAGGRKNSKEFITSQVPVAHACNPSYLGD
jgi:hypothetical protein